MLKRLWITFILFSLLCLTSAVEWKLHSGPITIRTSDKYSITQKEEKDGDIHFGPALKKTTIYVTALTKADKLISNEYVETSDSFLYNLRAVYPRVNSDVQF